MTSSDDFIKKYGDTIIMEPSGKNLNIKRCPLTGKNCSEELCRMWNKEDGVCLWIQGVGKKENMQFHP